MTSKAKGVQYPVTVDVAVFFIIILYLLDTLLIPSLSNKLLSMSQITVDLNYVALMYPTFCLLQDILKKEIVDCGTS